MSLFLRSFLFLIYSVNLLGMEQDSDLWNAEVYDEHSRLQQDIAHHFFKDLKERFPKLQQGACLLDIGCGNGRITRSVMESYENIQAIGIDSSVDMIQFANAHFATPRLKFMVDKAEELKSIESSSIDAIISFSCLHWVFDQQSAFERMHDVLKPGGWIGLMFAAETGFDDQLDHAFAQAMQEPPWVDYFDEITDQVGWYNAKPSVVKLQLEELGFDSIVTDIDNFDFYFNDQKAFRDWILASAQQLKLLPQSLQESCAERIVNLYLEKTSTHQPQPPQCIYQVDTFKVWGFK